MMLELESECVMDRNKTGLTHDVTAAVQAWMDGKGFKPVETEVTVCRGWCSDLAGVICPTQTEMIGLKLIPNRPRWGSPAMQKWAAERDSHDRVMTCCVEVKTSRSDYRGDRKWVVAQPTDLAYVAYPKGMVKEQEWPHGWGILEFGEGGIRCVRPPAVRMVDPAQQRDVILSIAVRRDHHTRYGRWRAAQKQQRVEDGERKRITRLVDIARFVIDIVEGNEMYCGDDLVKALKARGYRDLPPWAMEPLRKLWARREAVSVAVCD